MAHTFIMSNDGGNTRVLLIDDDVELSGMLAEYLESEGFAVSLAADGAAGLEAARQQDVSAIILDIMLPQMSGLDILRKLRAESRVPIIMLTARGDDVDRVIGLELGADDYVAKPYYTREIVARLRAVLRRQDGSADRVAPRLAFGPLEIEIAIHSAAVNGQALQLTATEFAFLAYLVRSESRVSTRQELSLKVLNRVWQAYDRSVDVHINNIRQKLASLSQTIEIETVRSIGYRLKAG
ncbi:MAG: response regulator transcription factor [Caulobacteraceae bacterium]